MKRNQIILVVSAVLLGVLLYVFADLKKPKTEASLSPTSQNTQTPAALDIESYIAEMSSKIEDEQVRQQIEVYANAGQYDALAEVYTKVDKPLAVAYYKLKAAEVNPTSQNLISAGDYSSMLMQTAPDQQAHAYLSSNAMAAYQKAYSIDSGNVDVRLKLANAYMEGGGAPMQGVSILLDIVKKDSGNVPALLMLGRFGILSGQYDKAIARLEKILYLHPQNSEALLLMAEAYNAKGDVNQAVDMLEKCKATLSDAEMKREIDTYINELKKPSGTN